ncbi:serine acetyltransferase [Flavobacterium jejuense]|uniref:Serine acetyltransferase n=1 Tax=Flavobacterium jejuense TaxID=1544455 RepID=A0ABX0IUS8_9FLAO|nr:serine O-acetyltransferase EpsC [Flavobacterium jejuense]NHN27637.1 serine acetyltransferase [Flavobacterium jejuense]
MNDNNSISKIIFQKNNSEKCISIAKKEIENWIENLFEWLFCNLGSCETVEGFQQKEISLNHNLQLFLSQVGTNNKSEITTIFFKDLVVIHEDLLGDLQTILEFDPAAKSKDEVLLAYPGFFSIVVYRIANNLWNKKVSVLPRVLSEYAHGKTGIDIHPGATIGKRFFIDHGTGIVIGETANIGNDVKIYQGVTLGALSVSKDKAEVKRHPTIEDNVIIYANATILGGKTVIGRGSVIGGNVWITESILSQTLVYHKSEIIVKAKNKFSEPINFSI